MKAVCSICSDLFDEINSVVSTPCGHTFHELCLLQWLEQSRTCPTCRKFASRKNILKVYFQVSEEEEELNPDTLKNEIQTLKATIKSQEMSKMKLSDEIAELRQYVKIAEDKTEEMKDKYFESQTQLTAMKSQMMHVSRQTAEIGWLRDENISLKKQISLYKNVDTIVSGSQDEVEEILKTSGEGPAALKQMAVYCSLLKKELQSAAEAKQKLSGEVIDLRKDLGWKTAALGQKISQIKHLNNTLQELEKENILLENKIKAARKDDQIGKQDILFESPAPERLKRKRKSTVSEDLDTSLVITPLSERHKGKKMKINMISSLVSDKKPQLFHSPVVLSSNAFKSHTVTKLEDDDTLLIRTGYNGLGGHSNHVQRQQKVLTRPTQKKKAVINKCKTIEDFITL